MKCLKYKDCECMDLDNICDLTEEKGYKFNTYKCQNCMIDMATQHDKDLEELANKIPDEVAKKYIGKYNIYDSLKPIKENLAEQILMGNEDLKKECIGNEQIFLYEK